MMMIAVVGLLSTDSISAFSICFQVEGLAWVVSITCCCCEKEQKCSVEISVTETIFSTPRFLESFTCRKVRFLHIIQITCGVR